MASRAGSFWRGRSLVARAARLSSLAASAAALSGCAGAAPPAAGRPPQPGAREARPADVALEPGYRIDVVAEGLTFPTAVAFDDTGAVHIVEAGSARGDASIPPRLLRVDPDGRARPVATGDHAPWTGVTFHAGAFYVAQGGRIGGGRVVRIARDGSVTPLVADLPSLGDHPTTGPAIGPDGLLYFAVGSATNSGVVGADNFENGWPQRNHDFHDIACRDLIAVGYNFRTPDPRAAGAAEAATGAYAPFGTRTPSGARIPGQIPCTGAIFRVPLAGGPPELVAWGFRAPYGLSFSPDGRLYVTERGFEERGSRPIHGAGDHLWQITQGLWYGWPDFAGSEPVFTEPFRPPRLPEPPPRLIADPPNFPPPPAASFAPRSSPDRFDFSRAPAFGHPGEAFIAQAGDMSLRAAGPPAGHKVVRVDVRTGAVRDFAANRGPGPASRLGGGGLEHPVDARFDPAGRALYVVDFGIVTATGGEARPVPGTGVLWRITRAAEAR